MSVSLARIYRLLVLAIVAIVTPATGFAQFASVSELAFVRDGQIFRVRADGTGLVQLTSEGVNREPAWAPDGTRIAFVRDGDIYIMNADGSNVVRRTEDGRFNTSPAWSPDGRQIAFSGLRDGQFGIFVMRVDGDSRDVVRLGFVQGWNAYPAWCPDGTRIAFVSDWSAFDFLSELYVMNADGSDIRLLLGVNGSISYYVQPSWSPDGKTIAITGCPNTFNLCFPISTLDVVMADGTAPRTLAATGGLGRHTWSADGTYVAFDTSACTDCRSDIYYVTQDGAASGLLIGNGHSPAWRPPTSGSFQLVAKHSQQCMDVSGASVDDVAPVIQWNCHGNLNQLWSVEPPGNGHVRIVARHSGKCLDVSGASLDNAAPVIQFACHGGENQQWRVENAADGYVRIVSRHSGQCLDVTGASSEAGATVIQWPCHGEANQQWRLLR